MVMDLLDNVGAVGSIPSRTRSQLVTQLDLDIANANAAKALAKVAQSRYDIAHAFPDGANAQRNVEGSSTDTTKASPLNAAPTVKVEGRRQARATTKEKDNEVYILMHNKMIMMMNRNDMLQKLLDKANRMLCGSEYTSTSSDEEVRTVPRVNRETRGANLCEAVHASHVECDHHDLPHHNETDKATYALFTKDDDVRVFIHEKDNEVQELKARNDALQAMLKEMPNKDAALSDMLMDEVGLLYHRTALHYVLQRTLDATFSSNHEPG
eukprot:15611529-Heterocapsa_arctica.AAC.1